MASDLIFCKQESYEIIGAAMQVYNTLGHGFLEAVYQEALGIELRKRNVPFCPQQEIRINYGNVVLHQAYRADFVCFDRIIVEIKAVRILEDSHRAQLYNYLHATGYRLGLLINFGSSDRLEYERKIL